jgi:hypothetical protein
MSVFVESVVPVYFVKGELGAHVVEAGVADDEAFLVRGHSQASDFVHFVGKRNE